MLRKIWLLSLLLMVSACSQIVVPGETDLAAAGDPAALVQDQEADASQPGADPAASLPDLDDGKPVPTWIPAEIIMADESAQECDAPFDGQRPRFSIEPWATNFCLHRVPYAEIFSGGPPPDGIPPIDNPKFVSLANADHWLRDREPVIFFRQGEDARAYPLQILTWHEIVNDTVDGRPVVVTFCPLCNTALVFERPALDGELLTFGTSGNLRNSDLVMYDRQTESWWQQFSGEAIVGDLTGNQLTFLPASIIPWVAFKAQHPDGRVLSRDTGFDRRYGSNPYIGYDDVNEFPFLFAGELDDRLRPMDRVLGIQMPDGEAVAYSFERLRDERVINDLLGDTPIAAFWRPGTASALDTSEIYAGKDIGSTGVFRRTVGGQTLTFTRMDGDHYVFQDEQTGSTWNLSGVAVAGPLQGARLTPLPHHDTFWFAWAAFVPPDSLTEE